MYPPGPTYCISWMAFGTHKDIKHILHAVEIELNIRSALEEIEMNDVKYEE